MLTILAVTVVVGLLDHRHELGVARRASTDRWWCNYNFTRCRNFDEKAYEERWERRELAYKLTTGAAGAGAASCAFILVVRRRRSATRLH